ncbi:DEKNAAC101276 [Brettanomyces naardenensis]|uniref:inorganic diphosphatase n=1 Tax=Brettanomyces naardenensis TaxID=13370 RepID=A0A448YHV7_BRENA|nr:DEKNAAC101276 [Brettanomyces naardenensis]
MPFNTVASLSHSRRALFSTLQSGSKFTNNFKAYLVDDKGKPGSFFHDVPLSLNSADRTATMVVEIPRYTQGKFEISKELPFNPIVQDTKKGKLRFVNNVFPFHGYPYNYGALPQTWEDPTTSTAENKGFFGDNDPLDVVEIGGSLGKLGQVKTVRILGALALIDDGEMDWKIIAVDALDPLAPKLVNGIKDIEKVMPAALDGLRKWFKNYKRPTGKPENAFAFGGEYLDADTAMKIVEQCHSRWSKLIQGEVDAKRKCLPQIANTTLIGTPGLTGEARPEIEEAGKERSISEEVNTVYYFKD